MIFRPAIYSLFSYLLSPYLFTKFSDYHKLNSAVTPFSEHNIHYKNPRMPECKYNISDERIIEFLKRIKKKKVKPGIELINYEES